MAPMVERIYGQMADPKWVIAYGTCACSGGIFNTYNTVQGADQFLPVDVYVPGCPPRPEALLAAIIKLQAKVGKEKFSDRPDLKLPAAG
jgi:NADH-quinone oxidoreductase subunit B